MWEVLVTKKTYKLISTTKKLITNSDYVDSIIKLSIIIVKLIDKHIWKSDPMSYVMKDEKEQESRILNDTTLSPRTREALIHARIGQGDYRKRLLEECSLCPFTLVDDERLLIASHIKPWVFSNDQEKMDVKNGFVLTPTFDRLFDRGFISFEDDKTLVVSPWLSPMNQKRLGIYTGKLIEKLPLDNKRSKYLEFHRNYIFKH